MFLAAATSARAQVDLVDPDAKPKKAPPRGGVTIPPPPSPIAPADDDLTDPDAVDPDTVEEETPKPVEPVKPVKKAEPVKKVEPVAAPVRPAAPPIITTKKTDADLDAAWDRWRVANDGFNTDPKAEANARGELLSLREETGARDLEAWSVAMMRAAEGHEAQGSSAVAVEQALSAMELAPHLPSSHFGLARLYFMADPSEIPRYFGTLKDGIARLVSEPRYSRPLLADTGTVLLFAFAITGVLVVAVLFARRARYFLYDLHFFFPRAVPRWQTAAIGLLLVSLPIVFRLGLVPSLLVAFAAVTLYLTASERVVAAVLIGLIGVLPILGSLLVRYTAFADTPAELAWQLEAGGTGAEAVAQKVARRAAEDKADFGELFALGTFELRRGKVDLAIPRLKAALLKTPDVAQAQVNLAVAMLVAGDLENPKTLLETAAAKLPDSAAPHWNLGRYYQRRVMTLGLDVAASEVDKGNAELAEARQRDPSLEGRAEPANDKQQANTWLMLLPLPRADLVALADSPESEQRVRSQLTLMLLGDVTASWAPFYPALLCLLLIGLGSLSSRLQAARACSKCGLPMSRREDPELGRASVMCTACVNVFSKKGVVPPALKVRKQVEVARYQSRMDRLSFALGILCSGMGHVFKGLPVRGAVYAFLFLLAAVAFVLRDGVLRTPFESVPYWLKLVPMGVLLVGVYALSVRGLFKKQGQGAS